MFETLDLYLEFLKTVYIFYCEQINYFSLKLKFIMCLFSSKFPSVFEPDGKTTAELPFRLRHHRNTR